MFNKYRPKRGTISEVVPRRSTRGTNYKEFGYPSLRQSYRIARRAAGKSNLEMLEFMARKGLIKGATAPFVGAWRKGAIPTYNFVKKYPLLTGLGAGTVGFGGAALADQISRWKNSVASPYSFAERNPDAAEIINALGDVKAEAVMNAIRNSAQFNVGAPGRFKQGGKLNKAHFEFKGILLKKN
jgi:hypothetical protein